MDEINLNESNEINTDEANNIEAISNSPDISEPNVSEANTIENNYTGSDNDNRYNSLSGNIVNSDTLKSTSFYTESYKKPSKKKTGTFQMIIVALVSSILGGAIVGGALLFVTPYTQPKVKSFISGLIDGKSVSDVATAPNASSTYKKVEIVQSDSSSTITTIAEKVGPSVVGIKTTATVESFFGAQQSGGEGSGIILKSDGYIMTNFHVISDAVDIDTKSITKGSKIEVILSPSSKDKPYVAQLVGFDEKTDLAVIKVDATGLPAAELGDSDQVKVGELAVAIGNPGGMEYMGSVTAGIISGLNRTVDLQNGKSIKLIQTDAAINPGNSGGALLNSKGQVIGINSVKLVAQGFEGVGFAIPINEAKTITDSLMQFKYVKGRPQIGIQASDITAEAAKQYSIPQGCLVQVVDPLSPGFKAGLQRGDIITKFDGKAVKTVDELNTIKDTHKVGDVVTIEIYRITDDVTNKGENKTLKLTLGEAK
jgi:serine protease Do